MIRKGVKPNVCLVKEVNKAKGIFNTMAQSGVTPDVWIYNIMINGFCKVKMVDEALILFKEMRCRNIIPNVVTYNSLIDRLGKSGRTSLALKLVDEMHNRRLPPNIRCFMQKPSFGRVEDARNVFEDLLVKRYNLDVYTYTVIIQGLV
ncbi:pentatricopeptide repeat-containing protein At1g62720-like [Trifolium pratense]|uniref:pentatricopeptide repeat-containing protein At1g62720-like n=1 Tax=Trifolium pratense TaxID=57577 RepID=UPI001E6941A0|nr:pentatricopeptide repeat-containing protein At1g62720-like [Trifolium pratense]